MNEVLVLVFFVCLVFNKKGTKKTVLLEKADTIKCLQQEVAYIL